MFIFCRHSLSIVACVILVKLYFLQFCFYFSLQHLSETSLILRRNERVIVINICRSSFKVPVAVVRLLLLLLLLLYLNILDRFSRTTRTSNFMKIPPVGVELTDRTQIGRQTDRHDEANSRFLQFCERAH